MANIKYWVNVNKKIINSSCIIQQDTAEEETFCQTLNSWIDYLENLGARKAGERKGWAKAKLLEP